MFKWTFAAVISITSLALAACAASEGGDPGAMVGEKSSELVAAPMCRSDDECPVPFIACRECPDGVNFSCPDAVCTGGRCGVTFTPCPAPEPELIFCGGIAGIQCPAGLECVDDPRDDCSPCRGGADCGGICVELSCKAACDPTLICTQVLTCVDGQLYPTGCGPRNCDAPIGECNTAR